MLAGLRVLYAKLHLRIDETKTRVRSAFGVKFLGYALWVAPGGEVKRKVAAKAIKALKRRVRQLTRRNGGRSMAEVIEKLRAYVCGWKAYFRLAQMPGVWRTLDKWLRHRLRAIQLKHWKRGTTIYREARRLGASDSVARLAAGGARHRWRTSAHGLHGVLTLAYFDRLGALACVEPQLLEPPGADPHAGWCGRGAVSIDRALSRSRSRCWLMGQNCIW